MNNTLNNVLIFAAGAAVGSVVAWKFLKTKYERIAQEEIDSVKEAFSNRTNPNIVKTDDETEDHEEDQDDDPARVEYNSILTNYGYVNEEEGGARQMDNTPKPRVISPDDFGNRSGYDVAYLTLYADGSLAYDTTNELVDNVDALVGVDSLDSFGRYEADSTWVRNDQLKCDFEICKDLRNYTEVVRDMYPHELEE